MWCGWLYLGVSSACDSSLLALVVCLCNLVYGGEFCNSGSRVNTNLDLIVSAVGLLRALGVSSDVEPVDHAGLASLQDLSVRQTAFVFERML